MNKTSILRTRPVKPIKAVPVQKTAIISISDGKKFCINYTELEELSQEIFNRLFEKKVPQDNGCVSVEYEPNKLVTWDFGMAHYCFAKGRLSETDFVDIVFFQKGMEANHE